MDLYNIFDDDEDDVQIDYTVWFTSSEKRFRLSKDCVLDVLRLIDNHLEYPYDSNNCISPINQLLTCLRFYSTGGHLQMVADFAGMHVSSVSRIIRRVTEAIARLYDIFICLPENENEIKKNAAKLFRNCWIPRVIGAIDCTHIKIQSPVAYKNQEYRRTSFGVLKRRFPILAYGSRLKTNTTLSVIVAASVLHNIAIGANDVEAPPLPEELNEHVLEQLIMNGHIPHINPEINEPVGAGRMLRQQFINEYFANL
ncbi:hypothetical protein NQ317_013483 [Molorchus minor]|uniref:Nuclease HARBI1 n=1 Tax=Molorchus minor TaxID=1323400 RepID=A0ABQ9JBN4_9CUCU|nr:hypothetical protein NQ317_013483 [Molorchus minor]